MSLSCAKDRASSQAWATTSSTSTGSIGCSGSTPSSRDRSMRSLSSVVSLRVSPSIRVVNRSTASGSSCASCTASASSASAPIGRLQLVADVGHEVTPGMVEALGLGDVVDEDQGRAVGHRGHPYPQPDTRLPATGSADREVAGRGLVGGARALHHLGDLGGVDRAAADHPKGLQRGVDPHDGVRGVDPDRGGGQGRQDAREVPGDGTGLDGRFGSAAAPGACPRGDRRHRPEPGPGTSTRGPDGGADRGHAEQPPPAGRLSARVRRDSVATSSG